MSLWIDIKYTLRLLLKKPLFTLASMLIVAIGLGLTVYTYSLLSQLIFRPLTLGSPGELVGIAGEFVEEHGNRHTADPYHLNQISADTTLLQGMSLYDPHIRTLGALGAEARKVNLTYVQWNLFDVVGVQPILGRGFNVQDQAEGTEAVVVLSYNVWQNQFSGDENIIGTVIEVEAIPARVIGVMPEGFAFPAAAQVWQRMYDTRMAPVEASERGGLKAVGRLKEGVALDVFQAEMSGILQRHYASLPQEFSWRATTPGGYITTVPFKLTQDVIYHHFSVFIAMLVVVFLILLLTCINVGNLLLARVNERIKEVAIRVALGIPRKRLVLQMLWESIVICSSGALVAVLFALWGIDITNAAFEHIFAMSEQRPFWWYLSLDRDAVFVLIVTVLLMVVVTGLIPAWRALSADTNDVLRDGTRGALGKRAGQANKVLVVSEITLSCVVLVVATMLLSTSFSAQRGDYGVDTENRLTASVRLAWGSYPWNRGAAEARKKRNDFYYRLKDELEQLPNIHKVGYFSSLPGTGGGTSHFEVQGQAATVFNENPQWNFEVVSRDAWSAVGMKLIDGRGFDLRDSESDNVDLDDSLSPVIVNAAVARDLFPDGSAVGQRVRTVRENWHTEWRTIIGVVSDTVHGSNMQSTSAVHTGYGLMDRRNWRVKIVLHYSGSQADASATLQRVINDMNADATVHYIQSYDDLIKQPMLMVDAVNSIFLWCGLVALLLAASGIYAVSASSITLRGQEIATRRALGAKDSQVISLFLRQAAGQLLVGLVVGGALSLWLMSQLSQSMVFSVNSYLVGFAGIPVFIVLMVAIATFIPANRITNVEPAVGLREV